MGSAWPSMASGVPVPRAKSPTHLHPDPAGVRHERQAELHIPLRSGGAARSLATPLSVAGHLCLRAKSRMMVVWYIGSGLAGLQPGGPSGPGCLNRPFEASGDVSGAQRRVQLQTITLAILAGSPNSGHSAEAPRLPKPRVGSSSLSRATTFRVQTATGNASGPAVAPSACALRVPQAAEGSGGTCYQGSRVASSCLTRSGSTSPSIKSPIWSR